MKIVSIVGARPQFIKVKPLIDELKKKRIGHILIHTGQHYDYEMSKIFFDELRIKKPDYYLGVGSVSPGKQIGKIMQRTDDILVKEKPDVVLVYGDTNSTLGGALSACKLHIPVGHVESGLRSYNKHMPEEINRILTDHVSTILFCPSETGVKNLINEGFKSISENGILAPVDYFSKKITKIEADETKPLVINVGDIMYDVLLYAVELVRKRSKILEQLELDSRNYYLLTLHRAENTNNLRHLEEIIKFVNNISSGKTVIMPMHPRTKKIYSSSRVKFSDDIKLVKPVGYFDILALLENSSLVMTDSGGMQKEAYWLKVPCVTLRDETEWIETVKSGWNVIYKNYYGSHSPSAANVCYGDGKSAERIVNTVINILDVSR